MLAEISMKTFPYWLSQQAAQAGGCELPPEEQRAEKNMEKTHVSHQDEVTQSSLLLSESWGPRYTLLQLCAHSHNHLPALLRPHSEQMQTAYQ